MTDIRKIDGEALGTMRARGGTWAVYENAAMDSANCGHLQFLKIGDDCTCRTAPKKCPDTSAFLGWKYVLIGFVDLDRGEINPLCGGSFKNIGKVYGGSFTCPDCPREWATSEIDAVTVTAHQAQK